MHAPDDVTTSDLDALLDALDKADAAVREIYRKLADDPDLASEHETALSELHAKRRELAQRVGLAALAQRRASVALKASEPTAEAAPEPVTPIVVDTFPEAVLTNGNGDPPAPASDADLARFRETVRTRGLGNGLHNGTADTTPWAFVLHELLKSVGPPRDLGSTVAMIEEADALDEIGDEERQASWARLPRHAQQAWIGMLVARTRALKEHPSVSADVKTTAKRIINRYPAFASKHAPGHVNGLKVTHTPVHGSSWAVDAQHYWDLLSGIFDDEPEMRSPPSAPKRKKERAEKHVDDEAMLDPAWRLLPLVRGRKALLVGGDPREPNRQRLERAFQLAGLEWPDVDGPRKTDAIVQRICKGTYGLVIVLAPFLWHKQSNPIIEACKDSRTLWALCDGYGVTAVKLGIERFHGGPQSGMPLPHVEDDAEAERA